MIGILLLTGHRRALGWVLLPTTTSRSTKPRPPCCYRSSGAAALPNTQPSVPSTSTSNASYACAVSSATRASPPKAEASADVQYSLRLTHGDHLGDPDDPFAAPPCWRRPHLQEPWYTEADGSLWPNDTDDTGSH